MDNKKITFSEKALEQLDRSRSSSALTVFPSHWTWALLAATTFFALVLVVWGFYGTMAESVSGVGIVLTGGGAKSIVAGSSGIISNLNVHVGTRISRNQILGQIYQPEIFFALKKQETDYTHLLGQLRQLEDGLHSFAQARIANELHQEEQFAKILEEHLKAKKRAEEMVGIQEQLRDQGIVTKIELYSALDQMLQTESSLVSTFSQIRSANLAQKETEWSKLQSILELEKQKLAKEQELALASKLFRDSSWIRSDVNGIVSELLKKPGSYISTGDRIAVVKSGELEGAFITAYLPVDTGKKVRRGMVVFFASNVYPAAEYGYMKGVVREVSETAVSTESIALELENAEFSMMISGSGAMMRVVVDLLPDRNAPSGIQWTSRTGAPGGVDHGTFGTVIINTNYRTPASYVMPFLRDSVFGMTQVDRGDVNAVAR